MFIRQYSINIYKYHTLKQCRQHYYLFYFTVLIFFDTKTCLDSLSVNHNLSNIIKHKFIKTYLLIYKAIIRKGLKAGGGFGSLSTSTPAYKIPYL